MATNDESQSDKTNSSTGLIYIANNIIFGYKWKKDGFDPTHTYTSYHSSVFSNETSKEIQWRLKIDTNPIVRYQHIIKLLLISTKVNKTQCHCKFQLLNEDSTSVGTWEKPLQLTVGEYLDCFIINAADYDMFKTRSGEFTTFLRNTKMTVTCQINVEAMQVNIPKCSLLNDLDLLLKNQQFSDVTLRASGKEYQAHKAILAARSPVFNAMFTHEMEEKNHNRVEISDMDGEVLEEFLRFIYTGKVSNLENLASDLLPAAEKYGFENLKVLCGEVLCANISIDNAAEVLVLTDRYNLDELKVVARRYIGSHAMDVCKTAGWQLLTQSHPNLIAEFLCNLSQQLKDVVVMYNDMKF